MPKQITPSILALAGLCLILFCGLSFGSISLSEEFHSLRFYGQINGDLVFSEPELEILKREVREVEARLRDSVLREPVFPIEQTCGIRVHLEGTEEEISSVYWAMNSGLSLGQFQAQFSNLITQNGEEQLWLRRKDVSGELEGWGDPSYLLDGRMGPTVCNSKNSPFFGQQIISGSWKCEAWNRQSLEAIYFTSASQDIAIPEKWAEMVRYTALLAPPVTFYHPEVRRSDQVGFEQIPCERELFGLIGQKMEWKVPVNSSDPLQRWNPNFCRWKSRAYHLIDRAWREIPGSQPLIRDWITECKQQSRVDPDLEALTEELLGPKAALDLMRSYRQSWFCGNNPWIAVRRREVAAMAARAGDLPVFLQLVQEMIDGRRNYKQEGGQTEIQYFMPELERTGLRLPEFFLGKLILVRNPPLPHYLWSIEAIGQAMAHSTDAGRFESLCREAIADPGLDSLSRGRINLALQALLDLNHDY